MRPLKEAASIDLYSNRSFLKWFVLTVSFVIGAGSILYTNRLVIDIREREKRQVDLYARTLEYLANDNNQSADLSFILDEIVQANTTIPVILTDDRGKPEYYRNLPKAEQLSEHRREDYLLEQVEEMKGEHEPIQVRLVDAQNQVYGRKFIYYKNSALLAQLQFYPYVQLLVIILFGLVTYAIFNYSKSSEQNRVWVGLAKETAHQLGTPLSSLMAWVDYLKSQYPQDANIEEFDKDVERLEMITARFSSIGSVPKLTKVQLGDLVDRSISYLRSRLSEKINFNVKSEPYDIEGMVNQDLFSWVMENLIKNSVDAMEGKGDIDIHIFKLDHENVAIDLRDTGKGIAKNRVKHVFRPGFTTKQRGWGLGLTLVKRIIENYHGGRIFVKKTDVKKGTTFRIILTRFKVT